MNDNPLQAALGQSIWLDYIPRWRVSTRLLTMTYGYTDEGTIATPFDMTALNDLDRFHSVMDTIDRLPQTGDKGIYLKQQLKGKLVEHKQYIARHGEDMPEIRNGKWNREGTWKANALVGEDVCA